MISLIENLSKLSGPVLIVVLVSAILLVKQCIELVDWFKKLLENWRAEKNGEEKKILTVEERISKLESRGEWQYNQLLAQAQTLGEIKQLLESMQQDNTDFTIATARATLKQLSDKLLEQGFMTEIDYETFSSLADIYVAKGGNHTMKDKIIPLVRALPVHK